MKRLRILIIGLCIGLVAGSLYAANRVPEASAELLSSLDWFGDSLSQHGYRDAWVSLSKYPEFQHILKEIDHHKGAPESEDYKMRIGARNALLYSMVGYRAGMTDGLDNDFGGYDDLMDKYLCYRSSKFQKIYETRIQAKIGNAEADVLQAIEDKKFKDEWADSAPLSEQTRPAPARAPAVSRAAGGSRRRAAPPAVSAVPGAPRSGAEASTLGLPSPHSPPPPAATADAADASPVDASTIAASPAHTQQESATLIEKMERFKKSPIGKIFMRERRDLSRKKALREKDLRRKRRLNAIYLILEKNYKGTPIDRNERKRIRSYIKPLSKKLQNISRALYVSSANEAVNDFLDNPNCFYNKWVSETERVHSGFRDRVRRPYRSNLDSIEEGMEGTEPSTVTVGASTLTPSGGAAGSAGSDRSKHSFSQVRSLPGTFKSRWFRHMPEWKLLVNPAMNYDRDLSIRNALNRYACGFEVDKKDKEKIIGYLLKRSPLLQRLQGTPEYEDKSEEAYRAFLDDTVNFQSLWCDSSPSSAPAPVVTPSAVTAGVSVSVPSSSPAPAPRRNPWDPGRDIYRRIWGNPNERLTGEEKLELEAYFWAHLKDLQDMARRRQPHERQAYEQQIELLIEKIKRGSVRIIESDRPAFRKGCLEEIDDRSSGRDIQVIVGDVYYKNNQDLSTYLSENLASLRGLKESEGEDAYNEELNKLVSGIRGGSLYVVKEDSPQQIRIAKAVSFPFSITSSEVDTQSAAAPAVSRAAPPAISAEQGRSGSGVGGNARDLPPPHSPRFSAATADAPAAPLVEEDGANISSVAGAAAAPAAESQSALLARGEEIYNRIKGERDKIIGDEGREALAEYLAYHLRAFNDLKESSDQSSYDGELNRLVRGIKDGSIVLVEGSEPGQGHLEDGVPVSEPRGFKRPGRGRRPLSEVIAFGPPSDSEDEDSGEASAPAPAGGHHADDDGGSGGAAAVGPEVVDPNNLEHIVSLVRDGQQITQEQKEIFGAHLREIAKDLRNTFNSIEAARLVGEEAHVQQAQASYERALGQAIEAFKNGTFRAEWKSRPAPADNPNELPRVIRLAQSGQQLSDQQTQVLEKYLLVKSQRLQDMFAFIDAARIAGGDEQAANTAYKESLCRAIEAFSDGTFARDWVDKRYANRQPVHGAAATAAADANAPDCPVHGGQPAPGPVPGQHDMPPAPGVPALAQPGNAADAGQPPAPPAPARQPAEPAPAPGQDVVPPAPANAPVVDGGPMQHGAPAPPAPVRVNAGQGNMGTPPARGLLDPPGSESEAGLTSPGRRDVPPVHSGSDSESSVSSMHSVDVASSDRQPLLAATPASGGGAGTGAVVSGPDQAFYRRHPWLTGGLVAGSALSATTIGLLIDHFKRPKDQRHKSGLSKLRRLFGLGGRAKRQKRVVRRSHRAARAA